MPFTGSRVRLAVLGLALLLASCGKAELYHKLTETQANEMIAVLQGVGIDASKEEEAEKGWVLTTSDSDKGRAIQELSSKGYPREEFATLGTVFKKEGFVSSPVEERARMIFAMNQELSHTISEIDGVVMARVHLAIPENQPLAEKAQPTSASVLIKYRPGTNIEAQVGKIKALIVNSTEGLTIDNVSVETFPADTIPIPQVSASSRVLGGGLVGVLAVIAALIAAVLAYPRVRRWNQRRTALVRREPNA